MNPIKAWSSKIAVLALALATLGCHNKLMGLSATISVTPTTLAFGQGTVGTKQQIRVSVSNLGSAPLVLTTIKVATDPNNELSLGDLLFLDCNGEARSGGTTLAPGECARFTVTWSVNDMQAAAGSIEIDSNDLQNPVVTLPVTGTAVAGALLEVCVLDSTGAVDPTACSNLSATPAVIPSVDFGAGALGTAATRTVRLLNQGTAPLTFAPAPALSGSSVFALSGAVPGDSLAAGTSADLTITATPTATGTATSALQIASNDPYVPQLSVPITVSVAAVPIISVTPASLGFGAAIVGAAQTLQVNVSNLGTAPLLVSAVKVSSDPNNELKVASILTTDCTGAARSGGSTLAPSECAHFSVIWTPAAAHVATGSIEIDSNDPQTPVVTLPVNGNAVAPTPVISVTPSTLAFGSTSIGTPQQIVVSVSNVGTAPLVLSAVTVSSDPNNELALADVLTTDCTNASRSGGTTLAPGTCARFTVVWSPTADHAAAGEIEVDSNDPVTPVVSLPVSGNAVTALLQICVLDSSGNVVPAQCSSLSSSPQVIPSVAFGTVQPLETASLKVQLTNQGNIPLTFSPAPALASGSNAEFGLSGSVPGNSLAAGASAVLTVSADASAAGSVTGTLNIASNDPRAPAIGVPITMTVPGAQLCATSGTTLAFGAVSIGTSPSPVKTVTLTNCGQAPLTVNSFALANTAPTNGQFTTTGMPAASSTIAVGGIVTINVTYKPTAVQSDAAKINWSVEAGAEALTGTIAITGNGTSATSCAGGEVQPTVSVAAYYTTDQTGSTGYVGFTPSGTSAISSPVLPLDYVELAATATVASGSPTYTWNLVTQPAGSTTSLSSTTAATVKMQTLVSGEYVVTLVVKDSSGCVSNTDTIAFYVVPQGAIHIELVWNTSCGDLDLHYVAPGGTMCDGNDVFYADLPDEYGGPGFPDWGCSTNGGCSGAPSANGGMYPDETASDDATLDHDDIHGYGPENVTQKSPFNATTSSPYEVWVYYYGDNGSTSSSCGGITPTVYFYVDGQYVDGWYLTSPMNNHDAWRVANISVANRNTVTITASTGTNYYTGDYWGCGSETPYAYGYDLSRPGGGKTKDDSVGPEPTRATETRRLVSEAPKPQ